MLRLLIDVDQLIIETKNDLSPHSTILSFKSIHLSKKRYK